jgi:hypothetical protein
MIPRLVRGVACLLAGFVLFELAADELGGLLGELFAESVISAGNTTEGKNDAA